MNDATAFLSSCGAPQNKDQATGFGFSADSGASYTDQGGLPNADCTNTSYGGDPSVETWTTGGKTYFYVSSLFNCNSFAGCNTDSRSHIAMAACVAKGQGSGSLPILAHQQTSSNLLSVTLVMAP